MPRILRTDLPLRDVAIALALTAAGQAEAWTVGDGSRPVTVLAALLATTVVAFRSSRPNAAALVVVAAVGAKDVLGGADEQVVLLLAGVLAIFAAGARSASPQAERGLAALLGLSLVTAVAEGLTPGSVAFTWLTVLGPWVAGRAVRTSTERADLLEEVTRRRQEDAEHRIALAAAHERTRIARDLHDVVGHAVSVMVLQAGAAEQVVHRAPEQAAASLVAIQETGRAAVDDLRRALGILRDEDPGHALAPPGTVDALEALTDPLRSAGLDVAFRVDGSPVRVPDGVGMTAFRVTQEALTNVLKHAGPARVQVTVRYGADHLGLEVRDDGVAGAGNTTPGRGLTGMRERVALYGGSLDAGRVAGGDFVVAAVLPLDAGAGA